jgi:hypothetical protein
MVACFGEAKVTITMATLGSNPKPAIRSLLDLFPEAFF